MTPVLALRALGLGDALTGVPALRGLRRWAAPRPLVLAGPAAIGRWFQDLEIIDAWVDRPHLDSGPAGLPPGRHDAVDLHGNGPRSRDVLKAGQPARLLGFGYPGEPGPTWRADEHEVVRWCRLVAEWRAEGEPSDLVLPGARTGVTRDEGRRGGPVVVHPGAASGSRRWPAERWGEVAAALMQDGSAVVVTAGPDEHELARSVAHRAESQSRSGTATVAQGLSLPGLAELVAAASVVLSGDTGVAHLATALRTPSVVLFGPVSPAAWGPAIDLDRHIVLWHGDGSGDPHGRDVDPALDRIDVAEVLAAVSRLRRSGPRPSGTTPSYGAVLQPR
jgi:glycosyl transferase family 9 (putative heptosyltransferase)